MPKPICVPCQRFFRPKKNGFPVIEQMPTDNDAVPGTSQPEKWSPYKLWIGDLWECQGCKAQIVVGFASEPISEHFHEAFGNMVLDREAVFKVNDC